ncbi:DNA polymerase delta subunit 4 isoform X1 [Manis javanica]|uniref:DNA polymerase delta subunit 4 isoform X1 n=1 Tax=Manis javanica TaxID=9974 RepID=UPI003C6CF0AF
MGRKRLITDSYPVVKRREGPAGHSKGELAPELGEETQPLSVSVDEAALELLRQFDLAWQYGPCTAWPSRSLRGPSIFFPPWQGSHGCSAGIGQSSWAWSLPPKCVRCCRLTLEIPASSAASGISILFEAPLKTSCWLPKNLSTQEPVAAVQLTFALENLWQEGVSQGRKGWIRPLRSTAPHLTSRLLEPPLRADTAQVQYVLHSE